MLPRLLKNGADGTLKYIIETLSAQLSDSGGSSVEGKFGTVCEKSDLDMNRPSYEPTIEEGIAVPNLLKDRFVSNFHRYHFV